MESNNLLQEKTLLSDTQLFLLSLFSYKMSTDELSELKKTLVEFYNSKITQEASLIWEKRNYNNDLMDQIANGHLRKKKK